MGEQEIELADSDSSIVRPLLRKEIKGVPLGETGSPCWKGQHLVTRALRGGGTATR